MAYDWTGIYIGGAAASIGPRSISAPAIRSPASSTDPPARPGRLLMGARRLASTEMLSRVVVGFAADVSNGDDITVGISNAAGTNVHTEDNKTAASGTVRARLGYARQCAFYGTGGWAWSNGMTTRAQLLARAAARRRAPSSRRRSTSTVGPRARCRLRVLAQLGGVRRISLHRLSINTAAFPVSQHSTTSTTTVSSVMGGLNFRFDPFVTRY